jgi:hypothetical protein
VINGGFGEVDNSVPSPMTVSSGVSDVADTASTTAESDLLAAYNAINAMTGAVTLNADIGNSTITPGLYTAPTGGALGITGAVTLDGNGIANPCFIFQIGTSLTTAGSVVLKGTATASNVFWAVGSSATLGTGTAFQGNIMALSAITFVTGTSLVDGRALAEGSITLAGDTITAP